MLTAAPQPSGAQTPQSFSPVLFSPLPTPLQRTLPKKQTKNKNSNRTAIVSPLPSGGPIAPKIPGGQMTLLPQGLPQGLTAPPRTRLNGTATYPAGSMCQEQLPPRIFTCPRGRDHLPVLLKAESNLPKATGPLQAEASCLLVKARHAAP